MLRLAGGDRMKAWARECVDAFASASRKAYGIATLRAQPLVR
ncbi:hypothetical protein [Nostoc sp. FACHB-892]|nr:hypothetical protein [Nostoc sp. FACHB-892]